MLWIGRSNTMLDHYWSLPDGARTEMVLDVAIAHRLQLPAAYSIVGDVLRHHSFLAQCGRLIKVSLPVGLPVPPISPPPPPSQPVPDPKPTHPAGPGWI